MSLFRKRALVVEATQWFKNGDHPEDGDEVFESGVYKGDPLEGEVVRYYRTPELDGTEVCSYCNKTMHQHGWLDTPLGKDVVCPGDWVVTGEGCIRFSLKDDVFQAMYEPK